MDYKMLGKRLKEIRKMRNMSQQDLSYEIEYSIPHISHVENGSTKASLDFVVKAANACIQRRTIFCVTAWKIRAAFTAARYRTSWSSLTVPAQDHPA